MKIVFKNIDGSCGIITPTPEVLTFMTIEEIAEKVVPAGLSYRITDEINLPTDRTFRNAWTDDNLTETVDVDMTKARTLHMNTIRTARDEKFPALDLEITKKLANGQDASAEETQRQSLRDLPANTDLTTATTAEELKAIWPTEL